MNPKITIAMIASINNQVRYVKATGSSTSKQVESSFFHKTKSYTQPINVHNIILLIKSSQSPVSI
jgi:hypothetical protein